MHFARLPSAETCQRQPWVRALLDISAKFRIIRTSHLEFLNRIWKSKELPPRPPLPEPTRVLVAPLPLPTALASPLFGAQPASFAPLLLLRRRQAILSWCISWSITTLRVLGQTAKIARKSAEFQAGALWAIFAGWGSEGGTSTLELELRGTALKQKQATDPVNF